jgi:hypothetical protein
MPSSTPASANCAPTDAAELLRALEEVDLALSQLREHALGDLLGPRQDRPERHHHRRALLFCHRYK